MTTIYFVRHGQASFGAESYDQLSSAGEEQAVILGQYLKKILQEQPHVFTGTMQRHQQTAQLALAQCFPQVNFSTDANWNEFNHEQVFAKYEPRLAQPEQLQQLKVDEINPRDFLAQIFEGAIQRWTSNEYPEDYDESWPTFRQRIQQVFQGLMQHIAQHQPRYVLVFSSGGVISVVAGLLLELNAQKVFSLNWSMVNSSLTTVHIEAQQPKLISLNEHHFIKAERPELLTWI